MYRIFFLLLVSVLLLKSNGSFAQQASLAGYVVDAATNEKLIGATIYDLNTNRGVVSNEYGFFSLRTQNEYKCRISFVGYSSKIIEGKLTSDTIVNVEMVKGLEIEEVVVAANRKRTFNDGLSTMKLNPEMIKSLPALMGESDVLKAIQLQPGTQPGREGTSGFSVRGGSNDQNLFLLDGIPVYNVNHLFGFFSVFSPYAINSATYIKGAMPARYGGRLSSVIDLRLKEGNNEKLHGQVTAGIIASSIALDGPIIKDKWTFIVTARRTYLDIFSRPISYIMADQQVGYYFQDFTFKTNYKLNEKNKLFLSFYGGNDEAFIKYRDKDSTSTYKSKYGLGWGNMIGALRWNSILSKSLFSNTTLYYSKYRYSNGIQEEEYDRKADSLVQQRNLTFYNNVKDIGLKWDLDYFATNNLHVRTGFDVIVHSYMPGASDFIDFDASSDIKSTQGTKYQNVELSAYAEADYSPLAQLNFNLGLRSTSTFLNDYSRPILQPRLLARYKVNERLSFSTSFDVNAQYVHLVSNSSYGAPTDLWLPVMEGIPPQHAWQFTIGGNYQLTQGISLGLDVYRKKFSNLLEFKPTEIIDHNVSDWANVILIGAGEAQGLELMLEKRTGKLTGWVSYTLSKSDRQFEEINNGKVFPSSYDRRHNISVVSTYKINKNKEITASWVYTSGFYLTMNYNWYVININGHEQVVSNYAERNNYRTPAYHRLDLSYSSSKQKKRGIRTWTFGLYNAYNRINPFMVYSSFAEEKNSSRKLTVRGMFPIIPSVSYRYEF
ncbi:MAG: TonB-dependent receptor [Bacteroidales bacterium]|nr:TonB-dependent receptor [Bacteroidales bacterium]